MNEELVIVSPTSKFNIYLYLRKAANKFLGILNFLPLAIVVGCLSMPAGLLILQTIYHPLEDKIKFLDGAPLSGAPETVKWPSLNLKQLISGEWQRLYEQWLTLKIPFRVSVIRLHNQFYYNIFAASYMYQPIGLAIGKYNYLYPLAMIIDYCNPSTNNTKEALEAWTREIQVLADFFKKRSQQFIYMISPSKTSYYPEYFPRNYAITGACHHQPYIPLRNISKKPLALASIDVRENIMQAKSQYGYLLFPHNGLHWTKLGSAIATQAFIAQLNVIMGKHFPVLNYSFKASNEEKGGDNDLIYLANLFRTNFNYPSAVVDINYPPLKKTKPFKLAVVGDSMSAGIIERLIETKLFDQIDYYFYYDREHKRSVNSGPLITLPENESNKYEALLSADVVVLEENEVLRGTQHAELLFESVIGRPSLFKKYIKQ